MRSVAAPIMSYLVRALMQDGRGVHPAATFAAWSLHADDPRDWHAPA
jgi:hypothetical protein